MISLERLCELKGCCKYCAPWSTDSDFEGYYHEELLTTIDIGAHIYGNELRFYLQQNLPCRTISQNEHLNKVKINYCPMCGRKLGKE